MATCIVSFVDLDGIRHSVEVEAESLYEAGVLAIRVFRQHNCLPGLVSKLEVKEWAVAESKLFRISPLAPRSSVDPPQP